MEETIDIRKKGTLQTFVAKQTFLPRGNHCIQLKK